MLSQMARQPTLDHCLDVQYGLISFHVLLFCQDDDSSFRVEAWSARSSRHLLYSVCIVLTPTGYSRNTAVLYRAVVASKSFFSSAEEIRILFLNKVYCILNKRVAWLVQI